MPANAPRASMSMLTIHRSVRHQGWDAPPGEKVTIYLFPLLRDSKLYSDSHLICQEQPDFQLSTVPLSTRVVPFSSAVWCIGDWSRLPDIRTCSGVQSWEHWRLHPDFNCRKTMVSMGLLGDLRNCRLLFLMFSGIFNGYVGKTWSAAASCRFGKQRGN